MKLGMTGNRYGISNEAQTKLIDFLNENKIIEVHHGDCLGADATFHDICSNLKIKTVIHPPDQDGMRSFCKGDIILKAKKYLVRNKDIVNATDTLIAFPSTKKEIVRSGTWSTIRYARKLNKKVVIIYPDGEAESNMCVV